MAPLDSLRARLQALRDAGRERAGPWARRRWACARIWVAQAIQAAPELTPLEVMQTTGLSSRQVYEALPNGGLPCQYTGGQPRICQRDLEAWLSSEQIRPETW